MTPRHVRLATTIAMMTGIAGCVDPGEGPITRLAPPQCDVDCGGGGGGGGGGGTPPPSIQVTRWGPSGPPSGATGADPYFLLNFFANGDAGQCWNPGAAGARVGELTPSIVIDTDSRGGGCEQQFGIFDPAGQLSGLSLSVDFGAHPGSDPGQCWTFRLDGQNYHNTIPLASGALPSWTAWTPPLGIDTDNRAGYCDQTFAISGRDDVVLEVQFTPNGDGQCINPGTHFVARGHPVTLGLDTDDRGGGCQQQFRLLRGDDVDGDGIPNALDNCPGNYNPGQADCNGNGIGDACDAPPSSHIINTVQAYQPDPFVDYACGPFGYNSVVVYTWQQDCTGIQSTSFWCLF
jgi:hypothetical protein